MRGGRRVVATVALAALLSLAGCSGPSGDFGGDPSPVPTPDLDADGSTAPTTPAVTSAPPSSAATEAGRKFLSGVSAFPVRSAATVNDAFRVTYVSNDSTLVRDAYVLGLAYGGMIDGIRRNDSTWAATRMDALAVGADGPALARFRIPASWPIQYFRGTISARTFSERLRAALERTDADGQFPERDGQLNEFIATAGDTSVNVAGASTRNRTVFLTVDAPAGDRDRLRDGLSEVVTVYGNATADWKTAALELSIRDRDGEFVGWYRADAEFAANVSAGRADVTLSDRRFLADEGRLVG